MPLATETVEFDHITGLLIIRNPILSPEDECTILQQNGWTDATLGDLPEDGIPPTPGVKDHRKGLRRLHDRGGSDGERDGAAEQDPATLASAVVGGSTRKRIYKAIGPGS